MRIVIDGRLWSESGIGRYLRNLVGEIQKLDKTNDYFILLLKKNFDALDFPPNFHKVLADFKWYGVSEQVKLPGLLKSLKPDLVHFPHFNVPVFYSGKYVVTIHDLIHQHHQTRETTTLNPLMHAVKKIGYRKVFYHAVKNAIKIITPSRFVKEQLTDQWNIVSSKIEVTYEGVDQKIIDLAKKKNQIPDVRKPYLFYVGNAQPHKNISNLIYAFGKLKENYSDLNLVLAGPPHLFWKKIKKESHIGGVTFTGFVSDEELVSLYQNAESFVMPSLEEGFGIPILEAMACGCPVVSSNAASLPEIGGDAAIYFNPEDVRDMTGKINLVLSDEKLRNELIVKGRKRYQEFSWKKMAEETLFIYKNALNQNR